MKDLLHLKPSKYQLLSLIFLLTCFCPIGSLAQEGWEGDLQDFEINDKIIKIATGADSGSSTIKYDFGASLESYTSVPPLIWSTTTLFSDFPTSRNGFEWVLFSIQRDDGKLVKYTLSTESTGLLLDLKKSVYADSTSLKPLNTSYLESLKITNIESTWSNLQITAILDPLKGIYASISSPTGERITTYPYSPDSGELVSVMEFTSFYTTARKETLRWTLPAVEPIQETLPPLDYTSVSLEEGDLLMVHLNKPVSADELEISAKGLTPKLIRSEPTLLVIELGFNEGVSDELTVNLSGLRDQLGTVESLVITITTIQDEPEIISEKDTSPLPSKPGIYLTEIMAHPPETGPLRGMKYLELYNHTSETVYTDSLKIKYRNTILPIESASIPPKSYLLIIPYGSNLPISVPKCQLQNFPALSGDFELRLLYGEKQTTKDIYYFSERSYEPGAWNKGVAIERVGYAPDLWRSSTAVNGGTPGRGTEMKPYNRVLQASLRLSELFLTSLQSEIPFIELFNDSNEPQNLADLYLTYRTNRDEPFEPLRITINDRTVQPKSYIVLTPDSSTLSSRYSSIPKEAILEKIDLSKLKGDYLEMELRGYRDDQLIDRALYRSEWIGGNESGFALSRLLPYEEGYAPESWGISPIGGTPGIMNISHPLTEATQKDNISEWPEDPELNFEQLMNLVPLHKERVSVSVYTIVGQPLAEAKGDSAVQLLDDIKLGVSGIPNILVVIKVEIDPPLLFPEESRYTLTYSGVWQANSGM